MKLSVFNKKIDIDDSLIKEYEQNVEDMDEQTLRYLAKTGGASSTSSIRELEKTISEGIKEEISVYTNMPDIIGELSNKASQYEHNNKHQKSSACIF